jgi:hypothetical protein
VRSKATGAVPPTGGTARPHSGGPGRPLAIVSRAVAVAVDAAGIGLVVLACGREPAEREPRGPRVRPVGPTGFAVLASGAAAAAGSVGADSGRRALAAADSARRARADSLRAARDPRLVRAAGLSAPGLRLLVSLRDRRLLVLDGPDTLRAAPVGIGMDSTLVYQGRVWRFRTPRGVRRALGKQADPLWVPPEWHYVEVARARGLRLVQLRAGRPVRLGDTARIEVRGGEVGLVRLGAGGTERPAAGGTEGPVETDTVGSVATDTAFGTAWGADANRADVDSAKANSVARPASAPVAFTPFAADEEVIWDGTLYIPPVGTKQRRVTGMLGRYRLDLGDGYLIHGTPYTESIGEPSSHGCMRLGDDDIAWLYEHVPVGTPVYTY